MLKHDTCNFCGVQLLLLLLVQLILPPPIKTTAKIVINNTFHGVLLCILLCKVLRILQPELQISV